MLFNYQRRIQYRFYAKVTEVLYEVRQNAESRLSVVAYDPPTPKGGE